MNALRRSLPLLVLALGVFAAGLAAAAETVRGSGTLVSERRPVGAFTGVSVEGSFEVVLRPAAREAVEVRGDDNVLAFVDTVVEGTNDHRNLRIRMKPGARVQASVPVLVSVDVVRVKQIALGGSSRLSATGLRTDALAVSMGGSGEIRLPKLDAARLDLSMGGSGRFDADGRAGGFELSLGGSGRVEAAKLAARDVHVSVAGSASASVHADASLEVSLAGSGSVVYSGNVQPQVSIVGSGTVTRAP